MSRILKFHLQSLETTIAELEKPRPWRVVRAEDLDFVRKLHAEISDYLAAAEATSTTTTEEATP